MDWNDIETAPRDGRPLRFRRADGSEFAGRWQPYWCGSDCPCDVAGEQEPPMDCEPACWRASEEGSKHGDGRDPVAWSAPLIGEMKNG